MKILGHYMDTSRNRNVLYMKMSCSDLMSIWNRCSDAANFGANYISHSLPDEKGTGNTASMILNELIENAAKYSNAGDDNIEVYAFVKQDHITFQVDSVLDKEQYESFRKFAADMDKCEDLSGLYIRKMQALGEGEDGRSGLGLLMIVNNFDTKLGFKFDYIAKNNRYTVSVQSTLPIIKKT